MEQKTNIGNVFLSFSSLKVYGALAIVFLLLPSVVCAIGLILEKMTIKVVVQLSSAFVPIYIGYALRFYIVRNISKFQLRLQEAITADQAFKIIFGGFMWGFPVVCLATACYIYTKNTLW